MGNKEHGLDGCSTVEGESSSKILNTATKSQSYTHTLASVEIYSSQDKELRDLVVCLALHTLFRAALSTAEVT
jgi:hypothetical protein